MELSVDPTVALVAADLGAAAAQGLDAGAAASPSLTGLLPAGADTVSAQAAAAFSAEAAAILAASSAAHEELARVSAAIADIARMYTSADAASSAPLSAAVGPAGMTPPRRGSYRKAPVGSPGLMASTAPAEPTDDAAILARMRMMKAVDESLGTILATLARHGVLDQTMVVLTSDHGEMGMAHSAQRQKWFYQGYSTGDINQCDTFAVATP